MTDLPSRLHVSHLFVSDRTDANRPGGPIAALLQQKSLFLHHPSMVTEPAER
jgi:hypothetical protein